MWTGASINHPVVADSSGDFRKGFSRCWRGKACIYAFWLSSITVWYAVVKILNVTSSHLFGCRAAGSLILLRLRLQMQCQCYIYISIFIHNIYIYVCVYVSMYIYIYIYNNIIYIYMYIYIYLFIQFSRDHHTPQARWFPCIQIIMCMRKLQSRLAPYVVHHQHATPDQPWLNGGPATRSEGWGKFRPLHHHCAASKRSEMEGTLEVIHATWIRLATSDFDFQRPI